MSTHGELMNIGRVLSFLEEWDRGDRTVRSRMLNTFVDQNSGKTCCELEREFSQVSSLFLARLTTWMRLTYMFGTVLGLQLKAIGIFLSASGHDQYLIEFLEDGGALTLLDVLSHSRTKEADMVEALRLLLAVSKGGRKYKEIICECQGVKVIAECLAMSKTPETQEKAWALLESLSTANPKYQDQIYKSLIGLLGCTSPKTQQLVLQSLRTVQKKLKTANHGIVEPLLNMLKSLQLEVQDEAIKLILELRYYDVKEMLLSGLVALLRPNKDPVQQQITEEADTMKMTGFVPMFVQQAAAAKTIRLLAEEDERLSHEFLFLGVVHHLLHAMGNREHADAQIQASLALKHFVSTSPAIEEHVQRLMGSTLFEALMDQADTLYLHMDDIQAEVLLSNQLKTSQFLNGNKSD